jgi:hypothetical protein
LGHDPRHSAAPNRAKVVEKSHDDQYRIGYWKQVDGYVYYVEQVSTGAKTIVAKTMRKHKGDLKDVPE